jgi:tetratricopeptide (TPR) repeat protein
VGGSDSGGGVDGGARGGAGVAGFAVVLRRCRQRLGLTQEELAGRAGVSARLVRYLESGRTWRPHPGSVRRLAGALGLAGAELDEFVRVGYGGWETGGGEGLAGAGDVGGGRDGRLLPVVAGQLPADVADFTGRAAALACLDRLLGGGGGERASAVVISAIAGTAGVGKTALAVHWGHRVRDRFPDGQLYVNLRGYAVGPPVRPVEALAGFLRALGVPAERVPVQVEEAAGLYRSLLADRRVLVVLDNAAGPEQVRPLLPASAGCLVVVTSRDRLAGLVAHDGAQRLTLDVLTAEEAGALLARLLGGDRVAAEPDAAGELARLCAYLPLPLRIAAANLAEYPQRSIAGYTAELRAGNRLAALEVDGDEQSAVRAAFDLSYTRLSADGRRLFRLLGLVPGPEVTGEAAAALADTTAGAAGRLLARLAGAHLIEQRTPGRFAFHDLLRLYAADHAEQEDSDADRRAALGRLFDYYLHTADAAARLVYPQVLRLPLPAAAAGLAPAGFDNHARATGWLDTERANLVAAVTHAAKHGPRPVAWGLADALRGYFVLRMHTVDWLAAAHAALAAAKADGEKRAQAAAQLSLAVLHWRQSRYRQATDHHTQAINLARQTGWLEGEATALGNLGNACRQSGQLKQAADHHRQALALNQQTGHLGGQASALANLGLVYWELGQPEQAIDHSNRALPLYRKVGSRGGEANTLTNLGESYQGLGQFDMAVDHLARALALHREVGDRANEADTLRCLAAVHRDTGQRSNALDLAHTAVRLARDAGDRRIEADALNTLATVHHHAGHHQQAIDHHQQALALARHTGDRRPETEALIGLATTHQHLDQPEQALTYARRALTIARQTGFRILEGQALTCLAATHLHQHQPEQAISHAEQALAIHRETGHRLGEARTLLTLGHALHQTNKTDAATTHWQHALTLLTTIGTPDADQIRTLLTHPRPPIHDRPADGDNKHDGPTVT